MPYTECRHYKSLYEAAIMFIVGGSSPINVRVCPKHIPLWLIENIDSINSL